MHAGTLTRRGAEVTRERLRLRGTVIYAFNQALRRMDRFDYTPTGCFHPAVLTK